MLVCPVTGLPRVTANVWLSLNASRYSKKHTRTHLQALDRFYGHCSENSQNPLELDRLVITGQITDILSHFRSFISERQNYSIVTGADQSQSLTMVTVVLRQVFNEFRHRLSNDNFTSLEIERTLSQFDTLYRYLKPAGSKKVFTKRSLPFIVVEEIFGLLDPMSEKNIFRTETNRHRNFIAFALLYHMGLRRGELMYLTSECMHSGYDPTAEKDLFWLNVRDPQLYDPRETSPELKNKYSTRQIPLPRFLYESLLSFVHNYRGRCAHGFLLSSQEGGPLSLRSMNDICAKVSEKLTKRARKELLLECSKSVVTVHDFRHTCAVNRIRSYRNALIPMDQAESLMRAFFGWSPQSKMPLYYAKAFYEEQLHTTTWHDEFDHHVQRLRDYGG